jgi:hypothetical protein
VDVLSDLGQEEVGIAEVAEELTPMLVQRTRAEDLGAVAALDALFVKGPPVRGHERLGGKNGGVAGGTAGRCRRHGPRHPFEYRLFFFFFK